jgi:hypothetical protein
MRDFIINEERVHEEAPVGRRSSRGWHIRDGARIMSLGKLLGPVDVFGLRAACIGDLIPIRTHTPWEVLHGSGAGARTG